MMSNYYFFFKKMIWSWVSLLFINGFQPQTPGVFIIHISVILTSTKIAGPHITGVVQWIIFTLADRTPMVMELLAHAVDHLTQNFSSGSTQFNLLQFQKVQSSAKKFL